MNEFNEQCNELLYSILMPGEKIKKLRNIFNITQIDLAVTIGVSRVFISNIENGKNQLTWNAANKIIKFFNNEVKKKKESISFSDNFLMENTKVQIERIVKNKIKDILKCTDTEMFAEKLVYLEKLIYDKNLKFDLDQIFKLYEIIINLDIKFFRFEEAKIKVIEVLELTSRMEQSSKLKLRLYSKLSIIYFRLKNYRELIILKKIVENLIVSDIESKNYLKNIYYNAAFAQIELGQYSEALLIIKGLSTNLKFTLFDYQKIDIYILQAYCKLKEKKYTEAENLYFKILNKLNTLAKKDCFVVNRIKAQIYTGLSSLYIGREDFSTAEKYILEAKKVNDIKVIKELSGTINESYFFIECKINKEFFIVKSIFEKTIEDREISNTNLIDFVFYEMFMYCKNHNREYIFNLIDIMISKKNHNLNLLIKIYYYLKDIDKETSQKILKYCISI